jgi:fatty-acyl-CoA synthase
VAAVAVYSVPDVRSGDQVMAAVELLPGRRFDPDRFRAFLDGQPDLGTKWAPSFVRVSPALPQTASGKVTKDRLRAQGWWAAGDPVYRRAPGPDYVLMTDSGRRSLRSEFRHHGREHLVDG